AQPVGGSNEGPSTQHFRSNLQPIYQLIPAHLAVLQRSSCAHGARFFAAVSSLSAIEPQSIQTNTRSASVRFSLNHPQQEQVLPEGAKRLMRLTRPPAKPVL